MSNYHRTHHCGALNEQHIGSSIILSGWVHRRRDHGGLIFIDLRDRFGITQLVFDPKINETAHTAANKLRSEWVVKVNGTVVGRNPGLENPKMPTGKIEVDVKEIEVLSKAKNPPFSIADEKVDVNEELRLKYRYLDIRRGDISKKLIMRHKAMMSTRTYLDACGFLEISTPILAKSTPEGARDYLVPSRVHPGQFYALPQSPQLFKQLLMASGMDKYFQIAPCFRDEDLRADRQPEFTQIDIEMSFGVPDDIFSTVEHLLETIFKDCLGTQISSPFRRMPYQECMELYGTDKPDLRFDMHFVRLDSLAKRSSCSLFQEQLDAGGIVKGIVVKGGSDISRKTIDEYISFASKFGAQGLSWMKCTDDGLTSGIAKFFPPDLQSEMIQLTHLEKGDMIFIIADAEERVNQALDHLRRKIARERNLIDPSRFEFLWVTDFPLYKWNHETRSIEAEHHPFTSPLPEDIPLMDTDPLKVRSSSYDLVLNGYELASGSQRVHNDELQEKIFQILKLSQEDITTRFGFFIEALKYGTPPHLGIALGFDRLMMILTQTDNIRDVIAFPKTQKASDLMTEAPSTVFQNQLNDLRLVVDVESL